ncbi:MAG: hypothetical protein ACRDU9_10360, partial [Acidimicrobiia bacterium]
PHDVARALGSLGLPSLPWSGLALGIVEVVVGVSAFFLPAGLFAQGLLYLAFSIWVFAALRMDVPLASCGCLGKDDTPPSAGHLLMNTLAAVLSLIAMGGEPIQLASGLEGAAQVAVVAVGLFLSYIVLTDGARLAGARAR